MKFFTILTFVLIIFVCNFSYSQTIPSLPNPASYAAAEVWGDSIYFLGGSINYSGTQLYKAIYKYNGTSWSYYDTIPFDHVWGLETAIKGDSIFVFGGWPSGAGKFYLYKISTKTWTQLANGPTYYYGHSMEYLNGYIYAFYNGYAARYDPATNSWTSLATVNHNASFSSSTVYNNEIYISGWSQSLFYKYNPATNTWIQLSNLPEFMSGSVLRAIDNNIYLIGGSAGFSNGTSYSIHRYDPSTNNWTSFVQSISSKRAYMEDVIYKNKLYILGGMNENFQAVDIVEFVMNQTTDVEPDNAIPTEFSLAQNYPNPFNPSTSIQYAVGNRQFVQLKVYDILGNEVATLVNEEKEPGYYEVDFNVGQTISLSSGVYFYRLQAGDFVETKKMILLR